MNPLLQSIWMLVTTILLVWILRIVSRKNEPEQVVIKKERSAADQIALKLIQFSGIYPVYPFKSSGQIINGMLTIKFWHKDDPDAYYCINRVVDPYLDYQSCKNEIIMLYDRLVKDTFAETKEIN